MLIKIKKYLSNTKNVITLILISMLILLIYNIFWGIDISVFCVDFLVPMIYFLALRFYKKSNIKVLNIIFSVWSIIHFMRIFPLIKINLKYGYFSQVISIILQNLSLAIFTLFTLWCYKFECFKNNLTKKIITIVFIIFITYFVLSGVINSLNVPIKYLLFNIASVIYNVGVIVYLKQYSDYKIGDVKNG